jgi:hypothetical protein
MPAAWAGTWLTGSSPAVKLARMCPRPRRRGFVNCPGVAAAKTMSSTPPQRPASPHWGAANPVVAEDLTTVLALLDERRDNVITQRTRLINQLHALLRDLVPGGAPVNLTALVASTLLTTVRAAGAVEAARK